MRLRLTRQEHVLELTGFLRGRGFLVVERGAAEIDVHLLNHVSARFDEIQAVGAIDDWRLRHPDQQVEVPGYHGNRD